MLKKLLYLYNDGHNPFPSGRGGLGYKPRIHGGMIHEEDEPVDVDKHYENMVSNWQDVSRMFSSETVANDMFKEDWLMGQIHDFEGRPEYQKTFQEIYNSIKKPDQPEIDLNDYDYDKFYRKNFEYHEERIDDEDEFPELKTINERIEHMKIQERDTLKGQTIEQVESQIEGIEKDIKVEKKKIVINNLEKSKILTTILDKSKEDADNFLSLVSKGQIKKVSKKQIQEAINLFIDNVNDEDIKELDIENVLGLLDGAIKTTNVDKQHFNEMRSIALTNAYGYVKAFEQKGDEKLFAFFSIVSDLIMKIVYPNLRSGIDTYNQMNKNSEEIIKKLQSKKLILKHNIATSKAYRELIKEEQQEYNDRLQFYKRKKRDQLKKDVKPAAEEAVVEQAAEEPKKKSKPKKVKPIKKSEEETQSELLSADVSGRLETIEQTMSSNGKDLEKYLSGNGQTVLQYISGDRSKVHDNEMNESIPNIKITLTNGKKEDLRKAVTIDLYNDNHAYEIKNYKEYSITDKVIPVQESKLEGTGYFIPYYLKNGNLYNIQLNYIDPKTGKEEQKFILPENPNGRILHLVYRLQDGLYEFKPLETQYISLKSTPLKSKDGQPLYMFKGTTLKRCKDHHGNDSFNIQPHLRKIKT